MPPSTNNDVRIARCQCGGLTVTARGEPTEVYACSCLDCQRRSGSAFTYAALYPESAVSIAGDQRLWRHSADSGRWIEDAFCPTCGVSVLSRVEAFPGMVNISAGCFADPEFPKPQRLYWASRHHAWLDLPAGVQTLETQ